ncbi:MAG TPA: zinc-ribbon domain containing protein [Pyrinomonadaceae bacterium]|jgi:CxxC-x17-CxxC domain-containing protein
MSSRTGNTRQSVRDEQRARFGVNRFTDQHLTCTDCGGAFVWTAADQKYFREQGWTNTPKRCKPCRAANRNGSRRESAPVTTAQPTLQARPARQRDDRQRVETEIRCAKCGKVATVPFKPHQGRPVYCNTCFVPGNK